ncbi:hypothetical protein ACFL2Q_08570 [Thermodesulfobacteriota bacterium]
MSLDERLSILKEYQESSYSVAIRLPGVRAISDGLRQDVTVMLRRMPGPRPCPLPEVLTHSEMFEYQDRLYGLLTDLARSQEPQISELARECIPQAIADTAFVGRGDKAVERFSEALDAALTGKLLISVADLAGELERVRGHFLNLKEEEDRQESLDALGEWIKQLDGIDLRLENECDFATRLKRWAGNWTYADREIESDTVGQPQLRCDIELKMLAEDATSDKDLLDDDLFSWLCTGEAKKAGKFFWVLGMVDSSHQWVHRIEQLGEQAAGRTAFSSYFGGLARGDKAFAKERLDKLLGDGSTDDQAILFALGYLEPDKETLKRIKQLIVGSGKRSIFVENPHLLSDWIEHFDTADWLEILGILTGPKLQNSLAVIVFLCDWTFRSHPIEEELQRFVWKCLLVVQPGYLHQYECDRVASELMRHNPDKGFEVFELLLKRPAKERTWNPIERSPRHLFWAALQNMDREHAVRVVLDSCKEIPSIAYHARELFDQNQDSDILIPYAMESERHAEIVCQCITAGRPGFWHIAFEILKGYPDRKMIRQLLSAAEIFRRPRIAGSISQYLDRQRMEVERLLSERSTPEIAQEWLRELAEELRIKVAASFSKEADFDLG